MYEGIRHVAKKMYRYLLLELIPFLFEANCRRQTVSVFGYIIVERKLSKGVHFSQYQLRQIYN